MKAIFEKEFSTYFRNPLGFIYLAIYYLFGGQFFLSQITYNGTNDISGIFSNMYMIVLFTLPLLTMRLLAEEKRQRTDQALFTAPVTLTEVVVGKFLAAFALFGLGVSICIVYFIAFSAFSSPVWSIFLGNFLGILLLGGAMAAIGLFISSLTESQVLAAIGTLAAVFMIMILESVGELLPAGLSFLEAPLSMLAFSARYYDFTAGILNPAHVLYFISVIVVFLFLTICVLDKNRQVTSKWLKNTTFMAGAVALFVAVVVLVNVVFSLVMKRLPAIDLTENNIYQLTQDSADVLEQVDTPVEIIVCYDQDTLRATEYGKQTDELLKNYEKENKKISVRYADILKEPELVSEYSEYGIVEGSIIIHSDLRTKVAALNDCVEASVAANGYSYTYASKSEQVLTSGIQYVTENETVQVSLLTGHTELGCEDILGYLRNNNYEIREQNIATETIDPESVMAVLLAPTADYTAAELEKLDAFLDNDGNFGKTLVYIASHSQPDLPNLESFLAEWGIGVHDSVIVETESTNVYDQQGFMYSAVFTEEAQKYLEDVKNPSLPFLGYYCRTLEPLFAEQDNRRAYSLVESTDTSILYPIAQDGSGEVKENPGAMGIVVVGDRLKYIGTEERYSQVAAFASTVMFSSSGAVGSSFNNQDFTVELLNTFAGKQNGISIPSVSFAAEELAVTQSQYSTMSLCIGILLPLLMVAAGVVVWFRRRRL